MNYKIFLLFFSFVYVVLTASAQIPPGYYDEAEGLSGLQLKNALHDIIKDHVEWSYSDLRDFILKESDEDPNNHNNVILIYSGISRPKSDFGGGIGEWNREHVWAKSHGDFGTTPPAGTDAHHIRPADVQVNSLRGHLDFDNGGDPVPGAPGCRMDDDSFEPRDAVKGDVARMIFYMDVRYDGDPGEPDLVVVDAVNTYPEPEHGKLSTLLQWHVQDPPDDFERHRNDVVYSYQENRNPFIDHPEYVESIWGDPSAVNTTEELFVRCYPNPVTSNLYVEYQKNAVFTYTLTGIDGRVYLTGNVEPGKSTIKTSAVRNGFFILLLRDENNRIVKKYKVLKAIH